jgi:hypothetical protein
MNSCFKKITVSLALVLSPFAMANSIELVAGSAYASYTGGSYTPYQNGQGGEFVALDASGSSLASWVPTGYSSSATYLFTSGSLAGLTGFDTFCVQGGTNDVYFTPGTHYSYTESTQILGGPFSPLDLKVGVAWLYEQFATGVLSGYHYSDATQRLADAGDLQNAIWFLEGEVANPNNAFSQLAITQFGGLAGATASVNSIGASSFGVAVLNLAGPGQNQLIYNAVPDGGLTVAMLGSALIGLAAMVRSKKRSVLGLDA